MMLDSVKSLGEPYRAAMAAGLENRWMDLYPRPRKLSGAHMAGGAADVHPLVLMNYNDDYESVSPLAHEWGHAMHSYLSNKAQPFATADYATFVDRSVVARMNRIMDEIEAIQARRAGS